MLLSVAILVGLVLIVGFALGIRSQGIVPTLGLQHDRLRACPDSPNCVCSEVYAGRLPQHAIAPMKFPGVPADRAWEVLQQVIVQQGGALVSVDAHYLHATFTSHLFRFVDDVEARLDSQAGVIQLRSASRVGRSDLGVNRKRLESIRTHWSAGLRQ